MVLKEGDVCLAVFLDVAQAFDRVWLDGWNYSLKLILSPDSELLYSYLTERYLSVKYENEFSQYNIITPMIHTYF